MRKLSTGSEEYRNIGEIALTDFYFIFFFYQQDLVLLSMNLSFA